MGESRLRSLQFTRFKRPAYIWSCRLTVWQKYRRRKIHQPNLRHIRAIWVRSAQPWRNLSSLWRGRGLFIFLSRSVKNKKKKKQSYIFLTVIQLKNQEKGLFIASNMKWDEIPSKVWSLIQTDVFILLQLKRLCLGALTPGEWKQTLLHCSLGFPHGLKVAPLICCPHRPPTLSSLSQADGEPQSPLAAAWWKYNTAIICKMGSVGVVHGGHGRKERRSIKTLRCECPFTCEPQTAEGMFLKNAPYTKVVQCDNSLWRNSSVMLLLPLYPSNHTTLQPAVLCAMGRVTNGVERTSQKRAEKVLERKECHVMWEDTTFSRHISSVTSAAWSPLSVPPDGWSRSKLWRWFQVGIELQHQYELQGDVHETVEDQC